MQNKHNLIITKITDLIKSAKNLFLNSGFYLRYSKPTPLIRRKRLLVILAILVFIIIPAVFFTLRYARSTVAAWYGGNGWSYRKKLTIDHTKVSGGADLSNFPILVSLSDISLAKAQSNGNDILFTASNGTTKLDHEIEKFTQQSGTLVAWVRIPTLSYTADTVIYMYYGNSSASSQQNKTGVWDTYYKAVWHLGESSNPYNDSTGTGANSTGGNYPTQTPGKIGDAQNFTISGNKYIDFTDIDITDKITVEAWIKPSSSFVNSYTGIVEKNYQTSWALATRDSGNYNLTVWMNNGERAYTGDNVFSPSSWTYAAFTYDKDAGGTDQMKIYVNGSQNATGNYSTAIGTNNDTINVGRNRFSATWDGGIDEIRISNSARPAGWLATTYNTINSPSTFFTSGNEEEIREPVLYFGFNEGYGLTAHSSTSTGYTGTISGATWAAEDACVSGKCLYFNGSSSKVQVSNIISNIQSVSFWAKSASASAALVTLSNTANITATNGTITATGITSPSIYVNGQLSTTFTPNVWQHIEVTTPTALTSASTLSQDVNISATSTLGTPTTAQFSTSAANELLVAFVSSNIDSNLTTTTVSGAGLTWTRILRNYSAGSNYGLTEVWTAYATGQLSNVTVGFTYTGSPSYDDTFLHVISFTGADSSLGATSTPTPGSGTSYATNNITTTRDNSWIWAVGEQWDTNSTHTAGTNQTITAEWNDTGDDAHHWTQKQNSTTPTAGTSVTINDTAPTDSGNKWNWCLIEVIPASFNIGTVSGNYLQGFLDEFKLYDYARTAVQVKSDYAAHGSINGVSAQFGPDNKWMSNGLVGYWKMDEASWTNDCSTSTVTDSSGNGNNGKSCPASTGPTGGALGKFGNGGLFDGSNDYVDAGANSSIQLGKTGTVSLWFKATSAFSGNTGTPKNLMSGGPHEFYFSGSSSYLFYFLPDGATSVYSDSTSWDTSWHHVAVTSDGTTVYMYIDGARQTMTTSLGALNFFDNSHNLTIGMSNQSFPGTIDDVRIYNRALSPGEVRQLYNWAPGPRIYVNFDNSSGTTYYDTSGNSHNATAQFITNNQACNDWVFSAPAMDFWIKLHDSIASGSETIQNFNKTVTYTKGVDYDMDYVSGSIKLLTGGSMATGNWYYNSSTCTNSGPTATVGKFGKGLLFDGADDLTEINAAPDIYVGPATQASLMGWVYPNSIYDERGIDLQGIIGHNWEHLLLGYQDSYFSLGIEFTDGGRTLTSDVQYPIKNWYHVAGTWDGTYARIYVNGVLAATSANWSAYTVKTGDHDWYIGTAQSGSSRGIFNGILDEVKMYDYARTQGQIVEDMNGGHPAPGGPVGSAVGWWKFNEGTDNTCSGGSNDACNSGSEGSSLDGASTSTSWTNNGKFGKALSFNGSDSKVSMGDPSSGSLDFGTNDFTISEWINGGPQAANSYPLDKGNDNCFVAGYRFITNSGGQGGTNLKFAISDGTGSSGCGNTQYTPIVTNALDNNWHYIAAVANRTLSKVTIYVDGINKGSTTLTITGSVSSAQAFNIGKYFNGLIDEVKVYGAALTDDEIKLDYNQGSATVWGSFSDTSALTGGSIASNSASAAFCVPGSSDLCSPPVAYWHLDENTGTSAYDSSTNGYTCNTYTGNGGRKWDIGKFGGGFGGDIYCGDISYLNNVAQFTYSAWYNIKTRSDWQVLMDKPVDSNHRIRIQEGGSPGTLYFYVANGANTFGTADNLFTIGQWFHVEIVYNGSGSTDADKLKVYINGQPVSLTITGPIPTTTANLSTIQLNIGNVNGVIDETKVYSYARTPAQVAWDYNRGGPVGWWKMDEASWTNNCSTNTVFDSSGNSFHGISCPASTGPTGGATGKFNNAGSFDGSNDYVDAGNPTALQLTTTGTVAAWIKWTGGENSPAIVCKDNWADDTNGYCLAGYNGGIDGELANAGQLRIHSTNTNYKDNQWHHVAFTWDGTWMNLYIDGVSAATHQSQTFNPVSNVYNLTIGKNPATSGYYFTGSIDDVRIYNYALTATQIKIVYTNGALNFGPATGSP